MSRSAFSLVDSDSINNIIISPFSEHRVNHLKEQLRESPSPLSSVILQVLPLQDPFKMVSICLVVYFKILRNLSYNKVVLSHISRNRKCQILSGTLFHEIFINIYVEANIPPKSLQNHLITYFCIVFYWPHLFFFKERKSWHLELLVFPLQFLTWS